MISEIELIQFRNHGRSRFELGLGVNLIVGENAVGKTNVLEAIYLLATGESFRAQKIEEMVNWEEEVGHVVGKTENDVLQVTVTKGILQGKRVQKRLYKVNGLGKRKQDYAGTIKVVLFKPEDMELVSGEPSIRRGWIDELLTQIDRDYRWSLSNYQKGLKQRNRLLDQIREGRTTQAALYYWDQLLVKEAEVIHGTRQKMVERINNVGSELKNFKIVYQASRLTPEKLKLHFGAEVAMGYTLSGPHKDDLKIYDGDRDLASFGSRGEQRMAVLWLKKAQMEVMEGISGHRPILLLDDVLSELDHHHVEEVVHLCLKQQTILSTTDEAWGDYFGKELKVIRLGQ